MNLFAMTATGVPTKGAAAVDTSDYECVGLANARHRPAGEAPPRPTDPSAAFPAPRSLRRQVPQG